MILKNIDRIEEEVKSEETSEQKANVTMTKQISEISIKTKTNYQLEQLLKNVDDKFHLFSEQTLLKTGNIHTQPVMTDDDRNLEALLLESFNIALRDNDQETSKPHKRIISQNT